MPTGGSVTGEPCNSIPAAAHVISWTPIALDSQRSAFPVWSWQAGWARPSTWAQRFSRELQQRGWAARCSPGRQAGSMPWGQLQNLRPSRQVADLCILCQTPPFLPKSQPQRVSPFDDPWATQQERLFGKCLLVCPRLVFPLKDLSGLFSSFLINLKTAYYIFPK